MVPRINRLLTERFVTPSIGIEFVQSCLREDGQDSSLQRPAVQERRLSPEANRSFDVSFCTALCIASTSHRAPARLDPCVICSDFELKIKYAYMRMSINVIEYVLHVKLFMNTHLIRIKRPRYPHASAQECNTGGRSNHAARRVIFQGTCRRPPRKYSTAGRTSHVPVIVSRTISLSRAPRTGRPFRTGFCAKSALPGAAVIRNYTATYRRRSGESRNPVWTNFRPERAKEDTAGEEQLTYSCRRARLGALPARCNTFAVSELILSPVFSAGASFWVL